ncbi:MAG: glycosyltransferase [Bacteroidia bacterium]|nr:glycosyltransferase [Bacteroidia bacterium]
MKKVIVFNYTIPRYDQSSGERRFVGILKILAKHYEVDLCVVRYGEWLSNKEFTRYSNELKEMGVNVLTPTPDSLTKAITNKQYDFAYFEFFWIAEESMLQFCKAQPHAVTIIDSVDVHFAREQTQAYIGQISHKMVNLTKDRELTMYRAADIAIAVSHEDVKLLSGEGVSCTHFIPNVVETVPRESGERNKNVIFIGGYKWHPNVDAVKWFTKEIWPLVIKKEPEAVFQIIGSDPDKEIMALENTAGVKVIGFVPKTKPWLDGAAVSVAPLRYGGGMKGKVNEAMAHGVPVVATSIGAQGFNAIEGKEMMITDDPVLFAEKIITLFKTPDLQNAMGIAGQQLNQSICSENVVESQILKMMKQAEGILVTKKGKGNPRPLSFKARVLFRYRKFRRIIH